MRILVLGASGFIGFPAAQALVRAGHYVFGLTRSAEKAKQLAAEEIIPIIGEIDKPAQWVNLVKDLDVVIEAVGGSADIKKLSADTLLAVSQAARELRPQGSAKLNYIYTSGTWVHGDNRNEVITDTTPIRSPAELVAWRVDSEQLVINDKILNGFVIRPGLLYGRSGSLLAPFFKDASEGNVWYPGTPGGRFAFIHTDDLADLYVRASEKAVLCGGKIFDAANDITESADDVLAALAKVAGAKGYEYRKPTNLYEVALGTTSLLRPYLARALLGWHPSKPGFVDGLPVYYNAWKAAQ
ncbi:NAD(P)-binding protein [Phlegmacium glaucopus]|nr:NAD(P)-binding protein [Phlegmacium glaucopus]